MPAADRSEARIMPGETVDIFRPFTVGVAFEGKGRVSGSAPRRR